MQTHIHDIQAHIPAAVVCLTHSTYCQKQQNRKSRHTSYRCVVVSQPRPVCRQQGHPQCHSYTCQQHPCSSQKMFSVLLTTESCVCSRKGLKRQLTNWKVQQQRGRHPGDMMQVEYLLCGWAGGCFWMQRLLISNSHGRDSVLYPRASCSEAVEALQTPCSILLWNYPRCMTLFPFTYSARIVSK